MKILSYFLELASIMALVVLLGLAWTSKQPATASDVYLAAILLAAILIEVPND